MNRFLKISVTAIALLCIVSCKEKCITVEDFESCDISSWKAEGNAFQSVVKSVSDLPGLKGFQGEHFVASEPADVGGAPLQGALTSGGFTVEKDFLNFLFGGKANRYFLRTIAVELLVDGEAVRVSSPHFSKDMDMEWYSWDVQDLKGKTAQVRIRMDGGFNQRFGQDDRQIAFDFLCMSDNKLSNFNDILDKEITASKKYLLIPASNDGASSTLSLLADGQNVLGTTQSVTLARDDAEYMIPVDISVYKGQKLTVRLTQVYDDDLGVTGICQSDDKGFDYNERYRPKYHFSPDFGWTNDPNGMVYYDGEYHLAYQYNPYGTKHSNMHWGNAVSEDLIHWTDLPFIIAPDELGSIFSGSSTVDVDNAAGFGENAIVAMYTSAGRGQRQSIAYSNDRGRTFTKFEGNPVLDDQARQPNFRDPKLLRYGDKWIVAIAAGDVIAFYESADLKNWTHLSDFGKGVGSHAAVWECPDLMRMEYDGKEKWALIVNINPGGPNGGSVAQYFIGNFDGVNFKADELPYPLWLDEGVDNYAGVTFGNTGDRHIFMGWMSNWLYSNYVPTVNFRNAMTLPRDLYIRHNGKHLFLASEPSPEVFAARAGSRAVDLPHVSGNIPVEEILPDNNGAFEVDFTVIPGTDKNLSLVFSNSKGEYIEYTFDFDALTLCLDRSKSGRVDFYNGFAKNDILTHLVKKDKYEVKIFFDSHSAELFINDGDVAFTNCFFPEEVYNSMAFSSDDASVEDLTVYKMK